MFDILAKELASPNGKVLRVKADVNAQNERGKVSPPPTLTNATQLVPCPLIGLTHWWPGSRRSISRRSTATMVY